MSAPEEPMTIMGNTDWPSWVGVLVTLVSTVAGAVIGAFGVALRLSSRLDGIDARLDRHIIEMSALIDKRLAQDRHDSIYPTIDRIAKIPIEHLEDEVKAQGQNIAILLDRIRREPRDNRDHRA